MMQKLLESLTPEERLRGLPPEARKPIVTTWARTLNHEPRPSRGGLSRVQLYQQAAPTPEQIAHARARLTALQHKQQLAYETRIRRLDPVDDAFARLSISYAFMQAMGLVNDHLDGCAARVHVEQARARFRRPAA